MPVCRIFCIVLRGDFVLSRHRPLPCSRHDDVHGVAVRHRPVSVGGAGHATRETDMRKKTIVIAAAITAAIAFVSLAAFAVW